MAKPVKLSREEYDEFRSNMESKYHYEDMSDEEKARFDKAVDEVAVVDDNDDDDDEMEGNDLEREREHTERTDDDDDEHIL